MMRLISWGLQTASVFVWLLIIGGGLLILSSPRVWRKEKAINILAWGDMIDSHTISDFYRKTGIRIYIHAYSSNKELLVTAQATRGKGYDMIIAADTSIKSLRDLGLLKKLNPARVTHIKEHINPVLMNHHFDPDNIYTVPYNWEIAVIGYDKNYFKSVVPNPSWDLIFKDNNYKVAMINDPFEAINCAALYYAVNNGKIFGSDYLSADDISEVTRVLIDQRTWLEAYAEFRADYFLLTGSCPVVVSSISPILRGMNDSDKIDFIIPREGTFVTIENLALSAATQKDAFVYEFIDYLFAPEVIKHHYDALLSLPTTRDAAAIIDAAPSVQKLLASSREDFEKFIFYRPLMSESMLNDVWVTIKSH